MEKGKNNSMNNRFHTLMMQAHVLTCMAATLRLHGQPYQMHLGQAAERLNEAQATLTKDVPDLEANILFEGCHFHSMVSRSCSNQKLIGMLEEFSKRSLQKVEALREGVVINTAPAPIGMSN
jgi:hypothetical protein